MYCGNCGKKINDTAAFCPYCGGAVAVKKPEVPIEASYRSTNNVNMTKTEEALPVYQRKNKAALLVAFLPLICIIFRTAIVFGGVVIQVTTAKPHPTVEYAIPDVAEEQNVGGAM